MCDSTAARGGEDGVVAVILAMCLLVLAGMGALAIDLGKAFNLETQVQKAADAAALACASELDFTTQGLQQGEEAAKGFFFNPDRALVRNTQNFSNDGEPNVIVPSSTLVRFYLAPPSQGGAQVVQGDANDWQARYCEVGVAASQVGFSFASLIGAPASALVSARAVAVNEMMACQHPLLMLCVPPLPVFDYSAVDIGDALRGRGILLRPNTTGVTGANLGVLKPGAPATAPTDSNFAGRISPLEDCTRVGVPGVAVRVPVPAATVAGGINRRFGVGSVPPDYPAAANTMSFPRDKAAFVAGGLTGAGHHVVGNKDWVTSEFLTANPALASAAITGLNGTCTLSVTPTASTCTRFEVYLHLIGGLNPNATFPDRRIVTLPVMDNCAAANPTPLAWVEVFLAEQVGLYHTSTPVNHVTTGSHVANEIYVEFIGRAGRFGKGVMRNTVRLVE